MLGSTSLLHAAALMLLLTLSSAAAEKKPAARLLDRKPFDRITLNAANGNATIDVQLLELPNRKVPSQFPSGMLKIRRMSDPSTLYNVAWGSIARVDLYEQLLLEESTKLINKGDLSQAYEYLNFLHQNYSALAKLDAATNKYLWQDALATYKNKNYEEALTILSALHDINSKHRGLTKFVETASNRMISKHLAARDYASARSVLDLLIQSFPNLKLANVTSWQTKFKKGAAQQLQIAQKSLAAGDFMKARRALRQATAILPNAANANKLLDEIDRKSPQIIVSVDQLVSPSSEITPKNSLECSNARIAQLTQPKLINLIGFSAEGGEYNCPWGELTSDDSGLQLEFQLNKTALQQGITADVLTLELLRQADPTQPQYRADYSGLLDRVEIHQGNLVNIHWLRSHVRPEALLSLSLQNLTLTDHPPGAYEPENSPKAPTLVTYQLPKLQDSSTNSTQTKNPNTIVEKLYDNEQLAFADLLNGEVDVIARIPPWQINRLQKTGGIEVEPYRLPTIHVLLLNHNKPLLARREFRRALCYGINRPQILNDILLGGEQRPGFQVLSGPIPAGSSITDPVGYAYNQSLQPRPYEPRLATVLAAVARNSLAKLAAAKAKTAQPPAGSDADSESEAAKPAASEDSETPEATPEAKPVQPLVLAYSPNPVATTACQSIKLQLNAVGIPIKLLPLTEDNKNEDYDLRYAELTLHEPLVDLRRLLGPQGLANHCSSSMSLALEEVDLAKNWREARLRLQQVHQIAINDLPVIPLWQTIDHFAYRKSLRGLGTEPVSLYQNVSAWQRELRGAKR